MSNYVPVNAAPMTYAYGVNDRSIKPEVYELPARPIHLPLCFLWAEDGMLAPFSHFEIVESDLYPNLVASSN